MRGSWTICGRWANWRRRLCLASTVFSRAGGGWVGRVLLGDAVLAFPEIEIEFPAREASI